MAGPRILRMPREPGKAFVRLFVVRSQRAAREGQGGISLERACTARARAESANRAAHPRRIGTRARHHSPFGSTPAARHSGRGPLPLSHFEGATLRRAPEKGTCIASYSWIFATTPAPTVRPPSRIAKRSPSSIAIGAISSTTIFTLSPGITISTPSGSSQAPVTSVVRK